MTVYSMTGFGKGEAQGKNYTLTTEIKTVNNRFKDFKFRMSSLFNPIEIELRSKLESEFKRGSFDISVSYKKNEKSEGQFQIDLPKVDAYLTMMKPIFEKHGLPLSVSPTDFMRSDFSREEGDDRVEEMSPLVIQSFSAAIQALKISRSGEGQKLTEKLLEHLAIYEKNLAVIEARKAEYPELVKERLTQKLNEKIKDLKIDEPRFFQEVVFYLEKLDIDEEINRAHIHLVKLKSVLNSTGEIGRQIDFLLQELGRETNTMGSKSAHPEISSHVVEMKVQLEKIREQALNLE
jgi:uncharacterized protein (TIGR00255 family)